MERVNAETWLRVIRVSNLPTVAMNVICACVLTMTIAFSQDFSIVLCILFLLAMAALYCGGMAQNDWLDADFDSEHQPFRPIPSGLIERVQVKNISLGLLAAGVGILAALGVRGLISGMVIALLISAYNIVHKHTRFAVILMALCRLSIYLGISYTLTASFVPIVVAAGIAQGLNTFFVTAVARYEGLRQKQNPNFSFNMPLIPSLIAGMCVLDGFMLTFFTHNPSWLVLGIAMFLLTRYWQGKIRAD